MESLAQEFDQFEPVWDDYDLTKRKAIDEALAEASSEVADRVRAAVLATEHIAISRRFREFVLAHVRPSFYRDEAERAIAVASRPDLSIALRQAYAIRSKYVHHLRDIPRLLVGMDGFQEIRKIDGFATLTFAGLSRLARHVIHTFVLRQPKVQTEKYQWRKELPGMLTMEWAPEYWIGKPEGYDVSTSRRYLEAFIGQVVDLVRNPATAKIADIRPVLAKIEGLVPGLAKPSQRLPMLALYFLFNKFAPTDARSARFPELVDAHKSDFDAPSIDSLAAHFLSGQNPAWSLVALEELHDRYFRERHHADALSLGRVLEAAFTLHLAEQHRLARNEDRARALIGLAVEILPQYAALKSFEASLPADQLPDIDWNAILLPSNAG